MKTAAITLVAALFLTETSSAWQQWKELGPAPISNGEYTGRISAITCSPTDPDVYYVGGADGGVWKTTDGGSTWTPLTDQLPTTSIGSLALDPNDEQVVYAGTGEPNYANHSRYGLGIYKSTNGGATWQHLARQTFGGRCVSKIVVSPSNSQLVYASITRAGGFPELAAAKGHPGAEGPLGVFQSLDGGHSWTPLTNGLPALSASDLVMCPTNSLTLYAAIGRIFGDPGNGVYKTTDGGASWSKLAGGLPTTNVGRIAVAIAPSNANRLYAFITEESDANGGSASTLGAYRSNNAGTTWTSLPLGNIQSSFGWYLCVASVDPTEPDTAFFGGQVMSRTVNSGFSFQNATPPHVDIHALDWDASGRLLSGDDGGLHRSTNLGNSWESLNDGLGLIQFYAGISLHPQKRAFLIGGTQDNGSNRRTSNSLEWTQVFGADGGWTQVDPSNPDRLFVEFQGTGNLFRSENGGDSFFSSSSGIASFDRNCFLPPYLIDPSNPQRMLYGTQRIYESLNGGLSWSVKSGDLSNGSGAIRALAMAPSDPSVVYAATNDGNVLVSQDGGAVFDVILTDHPGWPRVTRELCVDPLDASTMYLATAAYETTQIRVTHDFGQTWTPLDDNFPDLPVNVLAVDSTSQPNSLYAGSDAGVFRSKDGGSTWHRYGEGLPRAPIIDLVLDLPRLRMVAATQGRGAWSVPISLEIKEDRKQTFPPTR